MSARAPSAYSTVNHTLYEARKPILSANVDGLLDDMELYLDDTQMTIADCFHQVDLTASPTWTHKYYTIFRDNCANALLGAGTFTCTYAIRLWGSGAINAIINVETYDDGAVNIDYDSVIQAVTTTPTWYAGTVDTNSDGEVVEVRIWAEPQAAGTVSMGGFGIYG